jgi:hypothetical protein
MGIHFGVKADAFLHEQVFMSTGRTAKPYIDNTEEFDDTAL